MHVRVNGEDYQLPEALTVAELVERVGLAGERIALEHNREIVPRSEYGQTKLADGDRVEIVRALGGG
jgi:sulfur carrier protein